MTLRPGRIGWVAAVLALFLGACSQVTGPSPCRGQVSDPADTPVHHDPDLEQRIPESVAGTPLGVQSFCANALDLGGINMSPEFLGDLGVAIDDVTYATSGVAIGDSLEMSLTAFRYHGAAEDEIRTAMLDALHAAGEGVAEAQRGGKQVDVTVGPMLPGTVLHVAEDTLFLLSGTDVQVDEVLSQLP